MVYARVTLTTNLIPMEIVLQKIVLSVMQGVMNVLVPLMENVLNAKPLLRTNPKELEKVCHIANVTKVNSSTELMLVMIVHLHAQHVKEMLTIACPVIKIICMLSKEYVHVMKDINWLVICACLLTLMKTAIIMSMK